MDWIVYAISYSLIWLLSWLPARILYFFSDLFAFLLWYVIPYRKKIVLKNLTLSFPDKQPEELREIAKRFYHRFCDTFIEAMAAIQ
jgi:KDO2-lipid IV(A) lauroyltransferase